MGLRIAILGSAPSSVQLAPFNDPAWKIWACSPANLQLLPKELLVKIDLWFEMHSWSLDQKEKKNPFYWSYLKQRKNPIIMQRHDPRFPASTPYPLAEVQKRWPWPARMALTSSPAEMMAMALLYQPEVIGLWGIDMATGTEWAGQRQGLQRWAEEAEKLGIAVITPGEADILAPPPLYGFVESTHMWRKMNARKIELTSRMQMCANQERTAHDTHLVLKGAMEAVEYDMRTWMPHEIDGREAVMPHGEQPVPVAPKVPPEPSALVKSQMASLKTKRNSTIKIGKPAKARPKPNGKAHTNRAKKGEPGGGSVTGLSQPSPDAGGIAPGGPTAD